MKILVLGFYGKNNIGDESYKETFVKLFPQHSLTFVDTLKKGLVEEHEAILLGGGNVIRKGFLGQIVKYQPKTVYAFSAGMEEAVEEFPPFKHVYARDKNTLAALQAKKVPCSFIPDVAMTLSGDATKGKEWLQTRFKEEGHDLYETVITVVVNSYMTHGGLDGLARDVFNFNKFCYDFTRTMDETPASFVFIPFGTDIPNDDRVPNGWLASKCKYWKKNYVAFDRLDFRAALDLIAASNLVISSRLHSSIFSFACGTPFIDITHHSKNELFLDLINKKENSVSYWNMDNTLLKNKIHRMMHLPKHTEHIAFREKIREQANAIHFD